jgi:hypothetical protein
MRVCVLEFQVLSWKICTESSTAPSSLFMQPKPQGKKGKKGGKGKALAYGKPSYSVIREPLQARVMKNIFFVTEKVQGMASKGRKLTREMKEYFRYVSRSFWLGGVALVVGRSCVLFLFMVGMRWGS